MEILEYYVAHSYDAFDNLECSKKNYLSESELLKEYSPIGNNNITILETFKEKDKWEKNLISYEHKGNFIKRRVSFEDFKNVCEYGYKNDIKSKYWLKKENIENFYKSQGYKNVTYIEPKVYYLAYTNKKGNYLYFEEDEYYDSNHLWLSFKDEHQDKEDKLKFFVEKENFEKLNLDYDEYKKLCKFCYENNVKEELWDDKKIISYYKESERTRLPIKHAIEKEYLKKEPSLIDKIKTFISPNKNEEVEEMVNE